MLKSCRSVGAVLCALALSGCALFGGGDDVASCDAVRVTFEDTLGQLRGGEDLTATEGEQSFDEDALRSAVSIHDDRRECFDDEHTDFLDPARDVLGEEPPDYLEPLRDQPGAIDPEPDPPPMLGETVEE